MTITTKRYDQVSNTLAAPAAADYFLVADTNDLTVDGYPTIKKVLFSSLNAMYEIAGSALLKSANLSDLANVATARTNLGLGSLAVINDAAADGTTYGRKNNSWVAVSSGALLIANNLSDLADVPTARTNLGLGTIATQAANNVSITGGSISGITDLAIADGGTGQSTAQAAIDALTQVSAATNEYVLTKDTATGNAIFKAAAGGSSLPVVDETALVYKTGTPANTLTFDVSAFTAARVVTWPNAAMTVAGLQVANVFTAGQQISIIGGSEKPFEIITSSSNPAFAITNPAGSYGDLLRFYPQVPTDNYGSMFIINSLNTVAGKTSLMTISNNGTQKFHVMNGGQTGIGIGLNVTAPAAQCYIKQASTTAAIPVLRLNQADLSEEFIRFEATVGAGNPIDTAALGAYYGKVRVYIEGVGAKWLALYD